MCLARLGEMEKGKEMMKIASGEGLVSQRLQSSWEVHIPDNKRARIRLHNRDQKEGVVAQESGDEKSLEESMNMSQT